MKNEFYWVKDNSKIWPSDDPKDRPSHTYICKICKKEIIMPYDAMAIPSAIDRHVESHYLKYKGTIE